MYSSRRVAGGRRHRRDRVPAVGLGRVHVQIAAEIGAIDEAGQLTGGRGLDLAARLAKLRRNPGQPERFVHLLFARAGHRRPVVDAEQPVLVQLESEADRAIAKGDVVRLRSGEVL